MKRYLMSGNEAIARGAYEAGIQVCSAYPGTPSTEILENLPQYRDVLYSEWAPNEKVAAEMAYGASIAGARSLCAMKHVGLNVAADPIFSAAYNGVGGAYIVVTADDPSMHSSQNEQDNRHYARAAKIAMVEPSDSQECLDFVKAACWISEEFDIPVLFRTTTRISHSKSPVVLGEREEVSLRPFQRKTGKYVAIPANAARNHPKLEENLRRLEAYGNTCSLNRMEIHGSRIGVIAASTAYQYAREAFPADTSFLKLGLTNPLPMDLIRRFAGMVEELYVIEELDDFMEQQIRAAGIACKGKEQTGKLYELNPQLLRQRIFGEEPGGCAPEEPVPSRPPALCPGCPHRGFFYTMAQHPDLLVSGDIGCYTLGASEPLNAMDSALCMGGGFTVAMGMAKALEFSGSPHRKVFGVLGDSTFFHSGMTGAAEILYNQGQVVPVILDNSITGMTGHQDNPGTGRTLQGDMAAKISIEKVLEAYGYEKILVVDPQDLSAMGQAVEEAADSTVPTAIVARRPCLLIPGRKIQKSLCQVDPQVCIGCRKCGKAGCPAISFRDKKAQIDPAQCVGCTVCAQICPVHAISKEDCE